MQQVAPPAPQVNPAVPVGDPNYYGQVDLVNNPPPPVVYATPVVVQPLPPGVVYPPIYLRVPPVYYQNWPYYCGYYNACAYPVLFVQDAWYLGWYSPWYLRWYPRGRPGFVVRFGYRANYAPRGMRPRGDWGHH